MTEAIRRSIGRPSSKNKGGHITRGGYITRGRTGRPYVHIYVRLTDQHLHPTVTKKGVILRSHLVWDLHHPDDPVRPGEVVHHINNDSLDDRIENLEKMGSQSPHAAEHFARPRGPMSDAHKAALSAAKRAKFPIPEKSCKHCGRALTRSQIVAGGKYCSPACAYAVRPGKPKSEW